MRSFLDDVIASVEVARNDASLEDEFTVGDRRIAVRQQLVAAQAETNQDTGQRLSHAPFAPPPQFREENFVPVVFEGLVRNGILQTDAVHAGKRVGVGQVRREAARSGCCEVKVVLVELGNEFPFVLWKGVANANVGHYALLDEGKGSGALVLFEQHEGVGRHGTRPHHLVLQPVNNGPEVFVADIQLRAVGVVLIPGNFGKLAAHDVLETNAVATHVLGRHFVHEAATVQVGVLTASPGHVLVVLGQSKTGCQIAGVSVV